MKKLLLSFLLLICLQANAAQKYDFYGQIKVDSIMDENDKINKYDAIILKNSQNIYIYSEDSSFHNVNKIQLNYLGNKFKIKYNKPATGYCKNVNSADSIFHYTDVICVVDKIKYNKVE